MRAPEAVGWEDASARTLGRASPTSLKLLATCPKAYAFRFLDRAEEPPKGRALVVGTLAHLALERAARLVLAGGHAPRFEAEELAGLVVTGDEDAPADALAEARASLRAYAPRFDASATRAIEWKWEMRVGAVSVRGRTDRLDVLADGADVRVIDYKNGWPTADREAYEEDPQTLLYGLAAREQYPFAVRITVEYHFLAAGLRWQFRQTQAHAVQAVDLVERAAEAYARAAGSGRWAPAVSATCARCDFRARCDAYSKALEQRTVGELVGENWTTEALIRARQECAALEAIAEARKKELNALLQPRISKAGGKVSIPGWTARIASRDALSYPEARSLLVVLAAHTGFSEGEVAEQVCEISNKRVERFLEEAVPGDARAKAEVDVEGLAVHAPTAFVEVRKGKEKP